MFFEYTEFEGQNIGFGYENIAPIFEVFGVFDKKCTHQPFGPVAFYGITEFFGCGKTYFSYTFLGKKKEHHTLGVEAFSFVVEVTKLLMEFDSFKTA